MGEPETSPRPEAVHAAAWWASRLGHASHDIGDRDADERGKSAFANAISLFAGRTFTPAQADAFRHHLAEAIEEHLRHYETGTWQGTWRPGEPLWGSYNRTVGCGYCPDQVLTDAARRAGFRIGVLDLPLKTVMWINPGEVRVAEGYSAQPVSVWQADNCQTGEAVLWDARITRPPGHCSGICPPQRSRCGDHRPWCRPDPVVA